MPQIPDLHPDDVANLIAEGGEPAERLARIRAERMVRELTIANTNLTEQVTTLKKDVKKLTADEA